MTTEKLKEIIEKAEADGAEDVTFDWLEENLTFLHPRGYEVGVVALNDNDGDYKKL